MGNICSNIQTHEYGTSSSYFGNLDELTSENVQTKMRYYSSKRFYKQNPHLAPVESIYLRSPLKIDYDRIQFDQINGVIRVNFSCISAVDCEVCFVFNESITSRLLKKSNNVEFNFPIHEFSSFNLELNCLSDYSDVDEVDSILKHVIPFDKTDDGKYSVRHFYFYTADKIYEVSASLEYEVTNINIDTEKCLICNVNRAEKPFMNAESNLLCDKCIDDYKITIKS